MSVGPNADLSCEDDDKPRASPKGRPTSPLLNYALTLEHLEYAFYRDGLAEFSDDELMNAGVISEFGENVQMEVPRFLETVRDHEEAHVDALTETVEKLGGDAVPEGSYDFGYSDATEFLDVARALENTGVAAYAGAASQIFNNLLAAAAGIHSVEARHAAFLNRANITSPFPDAVDVPKTMEEVLEIARQFIVEE